VRRAVIACLVLAGATSVASWSETATRFHEASWSETSTRFHQVDGRAWAGGQPSEEDLALFCGVGVRTIIDLRQEVEHDVDAEEMASQRLGMVFVHIPVRADAPEDRDADAFLAATSHAQAFPLLVHCASGNRAAAFWMIRRLVVEGWTPAAAEGEARRIGLRSAALRDFALDYASRRLAAVGGPEEDEP